MAFITSGDINTTLVVYREFKLVRHNKRGFEPWFTFWVKKRFLFLSWWSFESWSADIEPLLKRLRLTKEWDQKYDL